MTSWGSFGFNPIIPLGLDEIGTNRSFGPGSTGALDIGPGDKRGGVLPPERFGGAGIAFPALLGTATLGSLSQMTQPATVGYGEGQVDPILAREAEKVPYAIGGYRFIEPSLETPKPDTDLSGGIEDPQKKEGGKIPKIGQVKELNEAFAETNKKTFMDKLNDAADKIFTLQDKDPEAYRNVIAGLDLYNRGQKGENLAEALVGNSKFRNEQLKALLDNAYTQSTIDYRNKQIEIASKPKDEKSNFATSGRGLIPQLEDRITAEFFPGVDKETIPARQIAALSSLLIQDVEFGVDRGLSLNAAIDMAIKKAVETGSINKEKIIKDGGFLFFDKTVPATVDASKYTKSKSIKEVMEKFDFTESEAIEAIEEAGFIPR
tara:strand:- start:3653 stop:4780 length:1128 start_codon:yes stop_codon:yes gene_type:complete